MLRSGVLALLVLMTGACGRGGADDPAGSGQVVVLAASSMREAMTTIVADFEAAHPGTEVVLTFDGSSGLAAAIVEGASGDVFVSADDEITGQVLRSGAAMGTSASIATNDLQIAVAAGNPLGITGLDDLERVVVSLCRAEVPCGAYAEAAFGKAGVPLPDAGREANVKAVVTKVQLGEADAGIVYRTDVRAAKRITGVELAPHQNVTAHYTAVVLTHATNPLGAQAFLSFLSGREARATLRAARFGPP